MIVMFIGGLWHGAAWTFVVWGVIHGLCLVIERVVRAVFKDAAWVQTLGVQILLGLTTYVVVCFAWVFFRASDFGTASRLVAAMVGALSRGDAILPTREILQVGLVTAGLLLAHAFLRNTSIENVVSRMPRALLAGIWTVMICGIILTQGNGNAFIYFQF
jgi:alginate O-acetyltransferase complex protein AlgI